MSIEDQFTFGDPPTAEAEFAIAETASEAPSQETFGAELAAASSSLIFVAGSYDEDGYWYDPSDEMSFQSGGGENFGGADW